MEGLDWARVQQGESVAEMRRKVAQRPGAGDEARSGEAAAGSAFNRNAPRHCGVVERTVPVTRPHDDDSRCSPSAWWEMSQCLGSRCALLRGTKAPGDVALGRTGSGRSGGGQVEECTPRWYLLLYDELLL